MVCKSRIGINLAAFAGAVFFCSVTALSQSSAGSAPQQQPGTMQSQPGTMPSQPGVNSTTQDPTMSSTTNPTMGNGQASDKMFAKKALQGGMAEVQLGQLALQKSSNDDVKQFAQKMIDDHTKMGDQLKPIAQQIGVKLPDGPSAKDKATMVKLQALNGDAFVKAYVKDMIKDHKTDLSDFNTEAQNSSNANLKNLATQGSTVISQHLQMVQQISQKMGSTASMGGSR